MTRIEIKSIFGKILFVYENENATIKDAVEKAIKEKINLSDSNLSGSNLSGSDLSGSNLSGSNLRGSDLSGSNLSGSNLSGSDLSGSNLSGSNLSGSNLSGSNLSGSKNKDSAYLPIYCKWSNSIKGDKIQIGCKEKTLEEWDNFFSSNEEFDTRRVTEEFKQIQAVYESLKAYYLFLNK